MTLKECYSCMGADYADVMGRLGKEDRVRRFLLKIPDEPSFELLDRSMESGDGKEAFRAAHSLKGICMNLGLTVLCQSVSFLTEELRAGALTERSWELFEMVKRDYESAMDCIRKLEEA